MMIRLIVPVVLFSSVGFAADANFTADSASIPSKSPAQSTSQTSSETDPTAVATRLNLLTHDQGWSVLSLSDRQLVLQHKSNQRFVYLNEFPTKLTKSEIDAYIGSPQFVTETKAARKKEAPNALIPPTSFEVSKGSLSDQTYALLQYEVPTPEGVSDYTEREWAGKNKDIWQMTVVFTGSASIKKEEQTKLSDELMGQILVQEKTSKAAVWKVILDELGGESCQADELGKTSGSGAKANVSGGGFESFTKEECEAKTIAKEYRATRPPYTLQASWNLNQCPKAVVQGALKSVYAMEMGPEFDKVAACTDKIAQKKCGPYPQLAAGDHNYIRYSQLTNKWDDCTSVNRIKDMASCGANGAASTASGVAKAVGSWVSQHPLETLTTAASLPIGLSVIAVEQMNSQFAKSVRRDPTEALALVCRSVDGLACMTPEAQTKAWCECIGDAGATLASIGFGAATAAGAKADAAFDLALKQAKKEAALVMAKGEVERLADIEKTYAEVLSGLDGKSQASIKQMIMTAEERGIARNDVMAALQACGRSTRDNCEIRNLEKLLSSPLPPSRFGVTLDQITSQTPVKLPGGSAVEVTVNRGSGLAPQVRFVGVNATKADVRAALLPNGEHSLVLGGYSGAGYENPAAMLSKVRSEVEKIPPAERGKWVVTIGGTPDGIGAAYAELKKLGFQTGAIVSDKGAKYLSVADTRNVDRLVLIHDSAWGGFPPGVTKGTLSDLTPTSKAMVLAADRVFYVGGGDVSGAEVQVARQLGIPASWIPANMSHAKYEKAVLEAQKKGLPPPPEPDFSSPAANYLNGH